MSRRTVHLDFACLPALLAVMATSWAAAAEPFPFPAPPVRTKAPVYLAPEPLPTLPAARPSTATTQRLTPSSGIRTAQSTESNPAPRGGLVPPARKSVVADTAETDRRVERLKRQLEELNDMLSRPPVEPPVIERPIVIPMPETTLREPESTFVPDESPVVPSAPVPTPPAPQATSSAHPQPAPSPPTATESSKTAASSLIKGLPVSALDRVYVADNLFAAAEFVLADEIYRQVDRRAISGNESGWVEFQLANCSRRLGRIDDAKKRYRRIVADPTLGWLQDMAKWRLDAIDEREQLVKEHARLDAAIRQHTEAPNAATKQ